MLNLTQTLTLRQSEANVICEQGWVLWNNEWNNCPLISRHFVVQFYSHLRSLNTIYIKNFVFSFSIEWNSMILGGPDRIIVTKTLHKNMSGLKGGLRLGIYAVGV